MRNLIHIIFLSCLVFILGCRTKTVVLPPDKITETKTIKEIVRDTVIQVEADSAYYQAWIECSNGKPVIKQNDPQKQITTSEGKNLNTPAVSLDEFGRLSVQCKYLQNQLKVALKDKYILEQKTNEKTFVPPPQIIEKELSWWQKLWIALGKILSGVLIVYLGFRISWKSLLKL